MSKNTKLHSTSFFNSRLTSTISISLVLFLLGLIALMGLLANNLSVYVRENISFSVVLKDDMKDVDVKKLQKRLDISPFVKSTEFISKERASKELEEELGENPEAFLGFNPLLASIEVKLKSEYANPDSIGVIEKSIRSNTNVRDVLYRKDLLQMVNDNMKRIGLILFSLAAILMVISFALISNTIRLMVYSKRFLIYTMKLVGATNGFIRKPFIMSNIVTGVVAAFLAIGMMIGFFYYLTVEVSDLMQLFDVKTLLFVFVIVIVLGVFISTLSTYMAVNRYLNMKIDNLYRV
ncbi:MAG: permease-like cell division protein FtsX [Bacteroidales bacterium]|nr:permease-like cell division protein FtsX [Bacteroidales bacterium]